MRPTPFCSRLVILACLLAAAPATATAQKRTTPAPAPAPTPTPAPQQAPELTGDDLFDPTQVHDIALTVNSRDWRDLQETYKENTYYLADLRWRGMTVRNIGIRSRGTGSRSSAKPGLRLDFDRYSQTQEFLGFKSLVLDNLTQDPSMLKERISMQFFREMGLPAPRVVHARLSVNNHFVGLYAIVEPVDKRFLKRHFEQNDGYLYEFKYTDPYGFQHLGPDLERYAEFFAPKTHETASMFDLYRPFLDMTWAISESPDSQFRPATDAYLDPAVFLTHVAVESFLAENDGILGAWGMNNFYIYRFEDSTRFQLLPWDKDSTFWAVDYDLWDRIDSNALMARYMRDPELRAFYFDALRRCAELAMRPVADPAPQDAPAGNDEGEGNEDGGDVPKPRWLEQQVRAVYEQIRASAEADTAKPFSTERFEDETGKVLDFARRRWEFVLREISR